MNIVSTILIFLAPTMFVAVDSECFIGGTYPGAPENCTFHGWVIPSKSSFKLPAPHCWDCDCETGALSCCGYGWRAGPFGIPGCRRVIDLTTCDNVFVDAINESMPCRFVERIPA